MTYGLSDLWTRSFLSSDDTSSVFEAEFTRRNRFVAAMLKGQRSMAPNDNNNFTMIHSYCIEFYF